MSANLQDAQGAEDRVHALLKAMFELTDRQRALAAKNGGSLTEEQVQDAIKLQGQLEALESEVRTLLDQSKLQRAFASGNVIELGASAGSGGLIADFEAYLRTGEIRGALTDADNGTGVLHVPIVQAILEKARSVNPLFDLASVYTITGADPSTIVPVLGPGSVTGWMSETGTVAAATAPTFEPVTLETHELAGYWTATWRWLDSFAQGAGLLVQELARAVMTELGNQLIIGDGVSPHPTGAMTVGAGYTVKTTASVGTIGAADIVSLVMALKPGYRANASFVCSPATLSALMQLPAPFSGATTPLVTFDAAGTPRILGKPVYEAESAPDPAQDALAVAFGDWKRAYAVAVHEQAKVIRDEVSDLGRVKFGVLMRATGKPVDTDAAVLLKVKKST